MGNITLDLDKIRWASNYEIDPISGLANRTEVPDAVKNSGTRRRQKISRQWENQWRYNINQVFTELTDKLGTVADLDLGTELVQIPNTSMVQGLISTRIGTSGNLGDAALRNIGNGVNLVPDKAVLDVRLGTSGNLGNAALLTKQTTLEDSTADRVMLAGAFGVGGNVIAKASTNIGVLSVTGLYTSSSLTPDNEPCNIVYMKTSSVDHTTLAIKNSGTYKGEVYTRIANNDWKKLQIADYQIGRVSFYAMSTPPQDELFCNGAAVSRTTYAELFAKIGTTFGNGDGSTTFSLPDLRGEFIRGWDAGRAIDAGRAFGSWQDHEFESHSHNILHYELSDNTGNNLAGATGTSNQTWQTEVSGGTETRPRNVALLPCIKFR